MNDIEIKLLNAKLYLNYYKNNNILDRYATIIEGLVIDNDCLSVLKNPNEKLYITPLSKNVNKEEKYKDLEQIEKEHKEENGRLRDRIKELEGIIAFKSKKRKNGTMRYKKTNKLNKYGVNGVCQDMRALKRTGEIKYRAYITLFGKQHTLGTHNTLEEAIQARKDGEKMIENILKNKYKNY